MPRFGTLILALFMGSSGTFAAERRDVKPLITKDDGGVVKGDGVVVILAGGREIAGIYLGRRDGAVWIGQDGGEVGLEPESILKIKASKSNDAEFLRRKAALAPTDISGHWKLAEWASAMGLDNSAKSEATIVISLNPNHVPARQMLGQEKVGDAWLEHDDAMKAKGLVEYRGEWISKGDFAKIEATRIKEEQTSYRAKLIATYGLFPQSRVATPNPPTKSGYSESYISAPKGSIR